MISIDVLMMIIRLMLFCCYAEQKLWERWDFSYGTQSERESGERGKEKVLIRKASSLIQSSRKIFTAASWVVSTGLNCTNVTS